MYVCACELARLNLWDVGVKTCRLFLSSQIFGVWFSERLQASPEDVPEEMQCLFSELAWEKTVNITFSLAGI